VAVETSPQSAPAAAEPSRVRSWLTAYRYPLTVFLTSRLVVYLLFAMVAWTHRTPRKTGITYNSVFSPLDDWDAVWYHWVETHWYEPAIGHGNVAAFYPLFPLAWRGVSWLPLPIYLIGSLLSTAFFAVALCMLYRITLGRYDRAMAQRTVLFLAFWPLAFVFSMPYSESLFLVCSLGAFALTFHRRWWLGCAVGGLAVLARPVGVALFPAFAWRIYREHGLAWRKYLPLLLLVAADLAFFVFLLWRTGDFFQTLDAQHRGWGRGFVPLPFEVARAIWVDVIENGLLRSAADTSFTIAWCVLWWRAWWVLRLPGEYLIYAALAILLPSTGGSLLSMGRMGMIAFPLFWALAQWSIQNPRVETVVKMASPALLAALIFITFGTHTFVP